MSGSVNSCAPLHTAGYTPENQHIHDHAAARQAHRCQPCGILTSGRRAPVVCHKFARADAVLGNQWRCLIKIRQQKSTRASLVCQKLNTSCSSRNCARCRPFGTRARSTRESSSAAVCADISCSLRSSTTNTSPCALAHAISCASTSSICGLSMRHAV